MLQDLVDLDLKQVFFGNFVKAKIAGADSFITRTGCVARQLVHTGMHDWGSKATAGESRVPAVQQVKKLDPCKIRQGDGSFISGLSRLPLHVATQTIP